MQNTGRKTAEKSFIVEALIISLSNFVVKIIGVLFKILVPVVQPSIVTASIFAFYWIWQDFFQPLIFVSNPKNFTIPLALKLYTDPNSYNNYGGLFAMSVISLLPVILIFIKFQKYLVEGIATDGIKG